MTCFKTVLFVAIVGLFSSLVGCASMQACQARDQSLDYAQETGPVCGLQSHEPRALDAYPSAMP
jgi:hypothetical protein